MSPKRLFPRCQPPFFPHICSPFSGTLVAVPGRPKRLELREIGFILTCTLSAFPSSLVSSCSYDSPIAFCLGFSQPKLFLSPNFPNSLASPLLLPTYSLYDTLQPALVALKHVPSNSQPTSFLIFASSLSPSSAQGHGGLSYLGRLTKAEPSRTSPPPPPPSSMALVFLSCFGVRAVFS